MQGSEFALVAIDFFGFVISLFTIFIIAEGSSILLPKLRSGVLRLMWGVGCVALAFFWNILNDVTPGAIHLPISQIFFLPVDRAFIVLGVILMLLAASNLFRVNRYAV